MRDSAQSQEQQEPVRAEVVNIRDVGLDSRSGASLARVKAERAKVERERRRVEIEQALEVVAKQAAQLHVDLVLDAQDERVTAQDLQRAPDKEIMDRGMKAAKVIMDRLAPVVTKVEGDVTVSHVFEAIAQARAQR